MRDAKSFHARAAAIVGAVALVTAMVGSAAALTLSSGGSPGFEVFASDATDSPFTVQRFRVHLQGEDRVDVKVEVANLGSGPHRGNVTVQVRDADDTVLVGETKATGVVEAGETFRKTWRFKDENLVQGYDDVFLWVDQST